MKFLLSAVPAGIQNDILWRDTAGNVIQVRALLQHHVSLLPGLHSFACSKFTWFLSSRRMAGLSCFMRGFITFMGSTKEDALCHLARELLLLLPQLTAVNLSIFPNLDRHLQSLLENTVVELQASVCESILFHDYGAECLSGACAGASRRP